MVAIAGCFYCCFVWGFVLLSQGLTVESGYLEHMIIPRPCLSSARITGVNHHAWLKIYVINYNYSGICNINSDLDCINATFGVKMWPCVAVDSSLTECLSGRGRLWV